MVRTATPRKTRNSRGLRSPSVEAEGVPPTPRRRSARLGGATSPSDNNQSNRVAKASQKTRRKRVTNFEAARAASLSPTIAPKEEPKPATPVAQPEPKLPSAESAKPTTPTAAEPRTPEGARSVPKRAPTLIIPVFSEDDSFQLETPKFAIEPRPTPVNPYESHETKNFTNFKKEEGHKFGRKLYESIVSDHEKRGCECGLPTIHATKEEAAAGVGTFRFYYRQVDWRTKRIWVFMRRDDKRWHCKCDAEHLSDFALWVRKNDPDYSKKRKAEHEDLLELQARTITQTRTIPEPVELGNNRRNRSMYRNFAGKLRIMGNKLKGLLRNVRDGLMKSVQTIEADESRHVDETGSHLVVKRLKRQYSRPYEAGKPTSSDEELSPYFEWADDNGRSYVGNNALESLYALFEGWTTAIEKGKIIGGHSIHEIKNTHRIMMNSQDKDVDLSIAVHQYLEQHYGGFTKEKQKKAEEKFKTLSADVCHFLKTTYSDAEDNNFTQWKAQFSKPPRHLPQDMFSYMERFAAKETRDFLIFVLSLKEMFRAGTRDNVHEALAKILVDLDAVHKLEVPSSFVAYPGRNGEPVMPGSFPVDVDELVEEIPADEAHLKIRPAYELRHPDPEPAINAATPYMPRRVHTMRQPRGILRKNGQPFRWPPSPLPGDRPRVTRLQFNDRVAEFKPIHNLTEKYGIRKAPSARTKRLWDQWWGYLMGNHNSHVQGRVGAIALSIPYGRPEDQTMEEAGGFGEKTDSETGERVSKRFQTKYDVFLHEMQQELSGQKAVSPVLKRDGTPLVSTNTEWRKHLQALASQPTPEKNAPRPGDHLVLQRPKCLTPPTQPAKTAEEQKRELERVFNDLEINEKGELVPIEPLLPHSELVIATRKITDLELQRQLREEEKVDAERKLKEEARRLAAEKARREAEKKARLERERREREEAQRREKELAPIREAAQRLAQLGLRAPLKPMINTLPADWQTRVDETRQAPDLSAPLITASDGTALSRRDFEEKLLPPTAWLNDNVMGSSVRYIADWVNKRAASSDQPPCVATNTFFWPFVEDAKPNIARVSKKQGIRPDNFTKIKTILIPINKNAHWTLAVVFPQLKAVTHMDSFRRGHGDPRVHERLLNWTKTMMGSAFKKEEWVSLNIDAPQQTNGWDCGVFAITNSLCIALGIDPNKAYSESQLAAQRHQLAAILLNGGFQGDFDLSDL